MTARFKLACCCLAACAIGATGLQAQDPGLSTAFKFRALFSAPPKDQGLTNNVFGSSIELGGAFGLEVGYAVGPGKVTGELGYTFQTGDQFLAGLGKMPTSTGTTTIDASTSVESRKNKLSGMHLRLGYEAALGADLTWRAGLQFGGNTFSHQVIANINGKDGAAKYADSYTYVGSKSSLSPSPYCGVTFLLNQESAVDVGVLFQRYTALDYRHVANSKNQMDTVAETGRILPTLECAYVFRF